MTGDVTYQPSADVNHGVVPTILGGYGDSSGALRQAPPIKINMGPTVTSPPPPPPAQTIITMHTPAKTLHISFAGTGHVTGVSTAKIVGPKSLAEKALPFIPAVIGAALYPVLGPLAPTVGGGASLLWWKLSS